jgi:hypothetical protein
VREALERHISTDELALLYVQEQLERQWLIDFTDRFDE